MPMFFGCMSSKQAKPTDKKAKRKTDRHAKKKENTIQNGGKGADATSAQSEQPVNPAVPPHVVSLSQVDVTAEHVTTTSSDKDTSGRRQSFPTRPATIVKEDCLFSEIVSALGDTKTPGVDGEEHTGDKVNTTTESPPVTQTLPSATTPSATDPTPTTTTITTATATKEADSSHDSEEHPPTPPPRPKTSLPQMTAESSETVDEPEKRNNESPPSLPPRTVVLEKPSSAAATDVEILEPEESPPVLPPRSMAPSPPRQLRTTTVSSAPPKPRRRSTDSNMEEGVMVRKAKPASFREPPPLPEDWAIIELPKTDAELIRLTRQPEQLAVMASQYVVKHISLHTDVRMTADLSDQINAAFLEVSRQHRSILHRFLTDLIEDQSNSSGGDSQPAEPSHGAVIVLTREILRQFVTPESVVMVSLEVLQAVSRVSGATQSLVECEVTGAVLGTMSAHKSSTGVQYYCLEVLARIASFTPSVSCKPPLEQSATDLICQSLDLFPKSVNVVRAGCSTLSNLVTTLYKVISSAVSDDSQASEEQDRFMTGLLALIDYIFSQCLPAVRSALKCYDEDLSVKTSGRQCLVVYAQLEQLRQRKKQRLSGTSHTQSPPPLPARPQGGHLGDISTVKQPEQQAPDSTQKELMTVVQLDTNSPFNHSLEYENWDLLRGVLKKKSTLKGHSYSRSDLQFMWQLTKTQVVALVCALAVDGHVQDALSLLDQPVADMVLTKEVPPGIRDFVAHRCTPTHTLIDLDPGLFVGLIDAVRYPSLSYQMAQKCVKEVASSLDGEQQVPVVAVTVEFMASTITNRPLAPAMTVPGFVEEVCGELERAKAVSRNSGALSSLLSEIRQCARKTVQKK